MGIKGLRYFFAICSLGRLASQGWGGSTVIVFWLSPRSLLDRSKWRTTRWCSKSLLWFCLKRNLYLSQQKQGEIRNNNGVFLKVVLWWKSHLSYISHFKTYPSSQYKKKNAVYYFQVSLFVPEVFKFLKCVKISDDVINSTEFWYNMMNKDTQPKATFDTSKLYHSSEAFTTNPCIWCCFPCIKVSFGNWETKET